MFTPIKAQNYNIYFNNYQAIADEVLLGGYAKVFILCDAHTHSHCVYKFLEQVPFEAQIIEIEAGELNKTIDTCVQVWHTLSEEGCDRYSLLINVGGGVVTDLGGFVASCYQRGIAYMNVPTSLLAMVDASVGGKTGVDLGVLKNQIGVVSQPKCVFIHTEFLSTLPVEHLRAGLAEMIKHGIIASPQYFYALQNLHQLGEEALVELIYQSVEIKNHIVQHDPTEQNLRKVLNFGHTLGHAIESYCLNAQSEHITPLLHGEAVAVGMVLAAYLSAASGILAWEVCQSIKELIAAYFPIKNTFNQADTAAIIALTKHDKKAKAGQVQFVLISGIGSPLINRVVEEENIRKAFAYYYDR